MFDRSETVCSGGLSVSATVDSGGDLAVLGVANAFTASAALTPGEANGVVDAGDVGANGKATYMQVAALGPEWAFHGVGDFLGDGKDQFLIENTNGAVVVGEVGAGGKAAYTQVGALGPEWRFVGAGDYGGTGVASFLIENSNGVVDTATVVGGQAQYAEVSAPGPAWSFRG